MSSNKLFYLPLPFADYKHVSNVFCTSAYRVIEAAKKSRANGGAWVDVYSQGDHFRLRRAATSLDYVQVN